MTMTRPAVQTRRHEVAWFVILEVGGRGCQATGGGVMISLSTLELDSISSLVTVVPTFARWLPFRRTSLRFAPAVAHEEVYQHNTDVVTNYGHGVTIGRILVKDSQLAYQCTLAQVWDLG